MPILVRQKRYTSYDFRFSYAGLHRQTARNVVSIGIGGSYLGPEFVFEALRTEKSAAAQAAGINCFIYIYESTTENFRMTFE